MNAGRNSSCEHSNIEVLEMRKYTIRDWHQRKLCRTKITMSINSKKCEKTNSDLFAFCQRTKEKSSIFFQGATNFCSIFFFTIDEPIAEKLCFHHCLNTFTECMAVHYPSNDENNAVGKISLIRRIMYFFSSASVFI